MLDVPCLTLRDTTERPLTITSGTNELVGGDPERILAAVRAVVDGRWKHGRVPPLWDGRVSARIVGVLLGLDGRGWGHRGES